MELFKIMMELVGSVAMLVVAVSVLTWGPVILKAVHRSEERNLRMWERYYNLEKTKADAFLDRFKPQIDEKEMN